MTDTGGVFVRRYRTIHSSTDVGRDRVIPDGADFRIVAIIRGRDSLCDIEYRAVVGIGRAAAFRLLSEVGYGRIGFTRDALPAILRDDQRHLRPSRQHSVGYRPIYRKIVCT